MDCAAVVRSHHFWGAYRVRPAMSASGCIFVQGRRASQVDVDLVGGGAILEVVTGAHPVTDEHRVPAGAAGRRKRARRGDGIARAPCGVCEVLRCDRKIVVRVPRFGGRRGVVESGRKRAQVHLLRPEGARRIIRASGSRRLPCIRTVEVGGEAGDAGEVLRRGKRLPATARKRAAGDQRDGDESGACPPPRGQLRMVPKPSVVPHL